MKLLLATIVIVSIAIPLSTSANTLEGSVIALHSQIAASKNICDVSPNAAGIPCSNYDVGMQPLNTGLSIYLVVARANVTAGLGGMSCGVYFDNSIGMFGWTLCATLEFPNAGPNGVWPASGAGNRITWGFIDCARTEIGSDGVHGVAGAFYVYAYGDGLLQLTGNPNLVCCPNEFAVADCSEPHSIQTDLPFFAAGSVGFGMAAGCNPCIGDCQPIPVQRKTWGAVKSMYKPRSS